LNLPARTCAMEMDVNALPTEEMFPAPVLSAFPAVGHAGELHPEILEALNLPARTCAMEMDVNALPTEEMFPAPVLSAFPA
ncbi:hypothetical protein HT105_25140, partial [Bacteroides fragilis]|nr:hypothetical protein [Bacteroides fragilis]